MWKPLTLASASLVSLLVFVFSCACTPAGTVLSCCCACRALFFSARPSLFTPNERTERSVAFPRALSILLVVSTMAILKLPASRPRSGYTKSANATGGSRTDGVATRLGATSRQRSGVFGFAPQEEVTAVREESLVDQTRKQHEQNVSSPSFRRTNISGRRSCSLALVAGLAGISMAPSRSYGADALSLETEAEAGEGTGFLRNSGARGLLAEEEERLIKLRVTSEANAKRLDAEVKKELEQVIERARAEGEAEAKKSFERGSSLCATPYGIDIVGITEGIALIGALVGGK